MANEIDRPVDKEVLLLTYMAGYLRGSERRAREDYGDSMEATVEEFNSFMERLLGNRFDPFVLHENETAPAIYHHFEVGFLQALEDVQCEMDEAHQYWEILRRGYEENVPNFDEEMFLRKVAIMESASSGRFYLGIMLEETEEGVTFNSRIPLEDVPGIGNLVEKIQQKKINLKETKRENDKNERSERGN